MTQPTQVRRPWRATLRTTVQGILAFLVLLPFIVQASGLEPEVYPWLAGLLGVAAAVTRVMALPQVEAFLRKFVPFLAADPTARRDERGEVSDNAAVALWLIAAVLIVVAVVKLL